MPLYPTVLDPLLLRPQEALKLLDLIYQIMHVINAGVDPRFTLELGRQLSRGGAPTHDFPENCMKLNEFEYQEVSLAPPLRSANEIK